MRVMQRSSQELQGRHVGGMRAVVDQRHLAEEVARFGGSQFDLTRTGFRSDSGGSAQDHV